jgi:hypothetical protein
MNKHVNNQHVNDDALVDRLYGLSSEDHEAHLAGCADCARRWEGMRRIRADINAQMTASEPVSTEFLAAQRRRIYARLGESPQTGWRKAAWAPALAATALLAIGIAVYRPVPSQGTAHVASHMAGGAQTAPRPDADDAQLFADVYSMEQSSEPSVAAPIHTLFVDNHIEDQ